MATTALTPGQLALLDYHAHPSKDQPCFSHLLICSTAPLEAEFPHHEDIDDRDVQNSTDNVLELRRHLRQFFGRPGAGSGDQCLRVVVQIHGYNVPLDSVKQEFARAERKFREDARQLAARPPADYVLFVHYAWPSERIGAGGPLRWIRAMPAGLLLLFALAGVLGIAATGLTAMLGQLLLGIALTPMLLRMVVYFRDRDRAGSFGVFDAVEMIRALHHLVRDLGKDSDFLTQVEDREAPGISLSFIGHSMGTFLTTALVRVLTNVFDVTADSHLWQENPEVGPFGARSSPKPASGELREQLRRELAGIGEVFRLDRLILVAADIPVWSITSGRSNYLASCLRRFQETFLFVNDADMVLRLASTLANYFVFPSGTGIGGYRLGNLSVKGRGRIDGYGWRTSDLRDVELHGALRAWSLCDRYPFHCQPWIGYPLNVVDCTDYTDYSDATDRGRRAVQVRRLSAFTAANGLLRPFNYIATLVRMLLTSLGIDQIDSHGGYFRGRFCLNLLYELALRGLPADHQPLPEMQAGLKEHHISWISIPGEASPSD